MLHPERERQHVGAKVIDNVGTMIGIGEDGAQAFGNGRIGVAPGIVQPVQGLDNAHGWPPGPVKPARRCGFEIDPQVSEGDGPQPCIGMDDDAGRYGIGEA
jgi:hypothetical protein